MMTLQELTTLVGWATVINLCFLMVTFLVVVFFRHILISIHKKCFGLSEEEFVRAYFQYMAQFKIIIIVFFVVPYIALKVMG